MLCYLLQKAQQFERDFGTKPNVIYINPQHFEMLCREHPDLFGSGQSMQPGFRLIILPGSQLSHPEAALIMHPGGLAGTSRPAHTRSGTDPDTCRHVA